MVVISGSEYHRSCGGVNFDREAKRVVINNEENCPGCGSRIGNSEIIVKSGKQWHRSCSGVNFDREAKRVVINNDESCPK